MKNVVKKGIFFLCICLFTSNFVNAVEPAVTITASSSTIDDWSKTYNAGTANEIKLEVGGGAAMANKKPCGVSANQPVLSLSSSDSHYLSFELPSGSNATIDSILFRLSGNSTGTSDWFSPLFSCDETTFNTNKITGVVDVHFTGYDQACTDKMAKLTNGTKSCRMYRRVKYTPGTPGSIGSGSNYGSGQTTNITYIEVYLSGGAPVTPTVNSVTVSPASATLDPNGTQQLTANVDATPASADKSVTWTSSNPSVATVSESGLVTAVAQGTATITATSNLDNTKSGTCSVTVNAPAAPIPVTAIALNKSTTTIAIGDSETLTIIYTPADANTGKTVTWTSSNTSVATVDNSGKVIGVTVGTATITATSTTDASITASCAVTVQAVAVTGVSINPTSANLQIGGSTDLTYTVLPANATDKSVSWSSSNTSVATVNNGHVTAIAAGTAAITVTTTDGNKTATCSVTVTDGPPVPHTDLTLHEPGVYEEKSIGGGYNTELVYYNNSEYEVYYTFKGKVSGSSVATVATTPGGTYLTDASSDALDGWFEANPGSMEESGASATAQFVAGGGNWKMKNKEKITLHVKGFDEFAILAADNNASDANKQFHIFVNDVEKTPTAHSTTPTLRSVDLVATQEYVIRVEAYGGSQMKLYGYSLRVPKQPRVKYLKGNDSSQVVMQTANIKPIVYTTKYNNIPGAETRLEWMGAEANGITLTKVVGTLSDTLTIGGAANCPTGTYQYAVVAYYNGVETNRATGQFFVRSDIQATSDIDVDAFQNEEMDQITFRYYALSANDVLLTWPNGQPSGISGSGNNGKYIIGGTPNITGPFPKVFPFAITVTGADTVIEGKITVKDSDYGPNAVLYLYKNNKAYEHDGVYKYLNGTGTGKYHLIERKAKMDGLRPADQYANYKWILISEDVDADNAEILALARGEGNLPVLSMKSFSYTPGRLNWGDPNNGSLTYEEGRFITVVRDDHPIFKALNKKKGDRILVLNEIENKGLMPVAVNYQGTLCLATARTRDIENYDADGPEETFLHEVPAEIHRNQKYLCLPISMDASNHLHNDGKKLIDECVKYILSSSASIQLPDLAITEFKIGSYKGTIDDNENRIVIEVPAQDSTEMHAVTPEITLASPLTHVTPKWVNADGTIDFSNWSFGVPHTVSDYINVRTYDVIVRLQYAQGIEAVEANEWINIFDVYGRKVTTTNEDYRTMDLPKGMYIIVTESGQTIKIMR